MKGVRPDDEIAALPADITSSRSFRCTCPALTPNDISS
jgi:hypothetical protein